MAGFIISALGGSRTQIGGPTGRVRRHRRRHRGPLRRRGLFICTLLAGIILIILGATGMGAAVNFIPRPVVVGFTNGIAVLIASTQIKDFFGLRVEHASVAFLPRMRDLVAARWARSPAPLDRAWRVGSLLLIIVGPRLISARPARSWRWSPARRPWRRFAIPVETIGSRFGGIPSGLPRISIPAASPRAHSRR